jgi:hypothetical protein
MIEHFEMDLLNIIKELRREKEQPDRVIASLEELQRAINIATLQKPRGGAN